MIDGGSSVASAKTAGVVGPCFQKIQLKSEGDYAADFDQQFATVEVAVEQHLRFTCRI